MCDDLDAGGALPVLPPDRGSGARATVPLRELVSFQNFRGVEPGEPRKRQRSICQSRRIVRQNVFVSLGVVAVLVPAKILGLGTGPAVIMHEGSTLLVAFNTLWLIADRGATG